MQRLFIFPKFVSETVICIPQEVTFQWNYFTFLINKKQLGYSKWWLCSLTVKQSLENVLSIFTVDKLNLFWTRTPTAQGFLNLLCERLCLAIWHRNYEEQTHSSHVTPLLPWSCAVLGSNYLPLLTIVQCTLKICWGWDWAKESCFRDLTLFFLVIFPCSQPGWG